MKWESLISIIASRPCCRSTIVVVWKSRPYFNMMGASVSSFNCPVLFILEDKCDKLFYLGKKKNMFTQCLLLLIGDYCHSRLRFHVFLPVYSIFFSVMGGEKRIFVVCFFFPSYSSFSFLTLFLMPKNIFNTIVLGLCRSYIYFFFTLGI